MTSATAHTMHTAADRDWFAERVDALLPELYGTAVRLCRDRTDAQDLVAEAVAKAWEGLSTLEDRGAFRAWVFRMRSKCEENARAMALGNVEVLDGNA